MSSSIVAPSLSLKKLSLSCSDSILTSKVSTLIGFNNNNNNHGGSFLRIRPRNLDVSKVHMSVSVGSHPSVDDSLFSTYQPTSAFLFPGQGAQAVGMGAEVQNVPAAATLFSKANDILGFDLLDICINGPKEKLDSTVLSQFPSAGGNPQRTHQSQMLSDQIFNMGANPGSMMSLPQQQVHQGAFGNQTLQSNMVPMQNTTQNLQNFQQRQQNQQ